MDPPRPARPSWSGSPSAPYRLLPGCVSSRAGECRHPGCLVVCHRARPRTCGPGISRPGRKPRRQPWVWNKLQREHCGGPPDFAEHFVMTLHRAALDPADRGGHRLGAETDRFRFWSRPRRSARHYSDVRPWRIDLTARSAARCWRAPAPNDRILPMARQLHRRLIAVAEFANHPVRLPTSARRYPAGATADQRLPRPPALGLGAPRPRSARSRARARRCSLISPADRACPLRR